MKNSTATDMKPSYSPAKRSSKLSVIGFALMLSGPAILILAHLVQSSMWDFPIFAAEIIIGTAIILPGAGGIISIVALTKWKKIGNAGRALSIVTVVMCNPVFFAFYFLACVLSVNTLAGLPWM